MRVNFILLPHKGSWRETYIVKLTEELNLSPIVIVDYPHKGELQPSQSFIEINRENIIVSALKKHEDSEDTVLRCYETEGRETEAEIKLPFLRRKWTARFKPCEIKTFIIPRKIDSKIIETDMLEFQE